jgi:hypothetical protein
MGYSRNIDIIRAFDSSPPAGSCQFGMNNARTCGTFDTPVTQPTKRGVHSAFPPSRRDITDQPNATARPAIGAITHVPIHTTTHRRT